MSKVKWEREIESSEGLFIEFDDFSAEREDGSYEIRRLPAQYVVCDACQGTGKTSEYLGEFTQSEWAEQDEEFRENYMAGYYDRPCEECGGKRVYLAPIETQLMAASDTVWVEQYYNQLDEDAYLEQERQAELRAMGGR